jgi:hypothetical protein
MSERSTLVGYARKSKAGNAMKLSIDVVAFAGAEQITTKDGKKYVQLVINAGKVAEIMSGAREVTSISQMNDQKDAVVVA